MSSINEQSIVSALKQLELKKYDVEREDFVEVLAKDLAGILAPKEPAKPEEKKKKGGRKPKVAEPAPQKAGEDPAAPAPAPAPTSEEQPKKKKPGPKPKSVTDAAPAEEAKPKRKRTTTETIKLNKVLKDRAKKVADDAKVTWNKEEEKKLVAHLNTLGKEVYDSKPFEDHVKDFYTKKDETKSETVEVDMEEREFEGKTYFIDPNTKRVYEENDSGVHVPIGYAGMGRFEGLKVL